MLLAEITIILHTNLCIMNTVFSYIYFCLNLFYILYLNIEQ